MQSDARPTINSNGDYGGQQDPTAGNTGLQPGIVIRNTPYVWFLPYVFVSALNFAFRIRNMTAGAPLQIMYSR